jgi:NAD(P)-dependent dehydrogenase (short-subunit alcohol dehydrogenase family)
MTSGSRLLVRGFGRRTDRAIWTPHLAGRVGVRRRYVLVNCAGHGLYKPFLECTAEDLHGLMRVHYFAAAALVHEVLPPRVTRCKLPETAFACQGCGAL